MTAAAFARDLELVRAAAHAHLASSSHSHSHPGGGGGAGGADAVLDLALPAARMLLDDSALDGPALARGLTQLLSPATQPSRPIYRELTRHLLLSAFAQSYEKLPASAWSACEELTQQHSEQLRAVEAHAGYAPPPEQTPVVLWRTLGLATAAQIAQRDVDLEVVDAIVNAIVQRPGPEDALTPLDPEQSPDAWVYQELTGLHALANLALLRRSRSWATRVRQVGEHHLERTQPDHVTGEPWALFAFLWSPTTRLFAQQQLHDAAAYRAHRVAGLLLTDAAIALARFG